MIKRFENFNEAIVKWYDKGELSEDEQREDEPLEKDHKFKVVIGDWSDDGHGKSDKFVFKGNYPVETLRQAYKDSCKLTGVQFNHNQDYTGIEIDKNLPYQMRWGEEDKRRVCTEYGNNFIDMFAYNILKEFGLDVEGCDEEIDIERFVEILLSFIKLSLPDFQYEEAPYKRSELKEIPPLNGYWNKDLNVQFGYGLYD